MDKFQADIKKEIAKLTGLKHVPLEIPPDQEMGDYAFPCFVLSKELKKPPNEIAITLKKKIKPNEFIREVKVAGPYLNFFINQSKFAEDVLAKIAKEKCCYGCSPKKKENIMVEYFHANTHKGVHIGHIRNISMAEPLCRILECNGYKVLRVNYQGDIGPHVAKAIWGYLNLKEKPPEKHKGVWLGKIYAKANKAAEDPKVEEEIKDINLKIYAGDKKLIKVWKETRKWCLEDFNDFYKTFNVKFDELYFESDTEKEGKKIAISLLEKGIAEKSDGAVIVDLKKYNLGICILLTSQGYSLYQTKELGLAAKKLSQHAIDKSIHIVGAEQELFFRQMFKVYELMKSPLANKSVHLSYGLVMLPEGKMSSREGTMVLYSDLIGELLVLAREEVKKRHKDWGGEEILSTAKKIAFAALKFSMVNRETNKNITFDKSKALDFEGETGPYVQYAYARLCSILRKVKSVPKNIDFSLLQEKIEFRLISQLSQFQSVIDESAKHYRPHLVARYLLDLSQSLNEFYHAHQILKSEPKLRDARLFLISCVKQVLENGLRLLNIEAPEKM